jgi:type IV secretion system protein VirB6
MRVLGGAAIGAVGVSVALGLELALLEPWLGVAVARRMAGEALPTMPTELFVIVCLFGILVFASLYACARVARAFRFPMIVRDAPDSSTHVRQVPGAPADSRVASHARRVETERTRAVAIANVMRSASRRDQAEPVFGTAGAAPPLRTIEVRQETARAADKAAPLGRSYSRRSATRSSALAARRDAGA